MTDPAPRKIVVRPPRWYLVLSSGFSLACLAIGMFASHSIRPHNCRRIRRNLPTPRRMFCRNRGDGANAPLGTSQRHLVCGFNHRNEAIPLSEIASVRLKRAGSGLSRCWFLRQDGTLPIDTVRGTWPTADLLILARAMNANVQSL